MDKSEAMPGVHRSELFIPIGINNSENHVTEKWRKSSSSSTSRSRRSSDGAKSVKSRNRRRALSVADAGVAITNVMDKSEKPEPNNNNAVTATAEQTDPTNAVTATAEQTGPTTRESPIPTEVQSPDATVSSPTEDIEEKPAPGTTKNLLGKFLHLASQSKHHVPHVPSQTALKLTKEQEVKIKADVSHEGKDDEEGSVPEGGVYESQPIVREDVAKESIGPDETELPPSGLTRALLSSFRQRESSTTSSMSCTPRLRSRAGSSSGFLDMVPPVLSLHDDVASGPTVVESEPATRDGSILSEDATTEEDSMPAEGTTKNLLSKFSQITIAAKNSRYVEHKVSGAGKRRWVPKNKRNENPPSIPNGVTSSSKKESKPSEPGEIVKENDMTNVEEELPKQGFTRGLLNKFQSMEKS